MQYQGWSHMGSDHHDLSSNWQTQSNQIRGRQIVRVSEYYLHNFFNKISFFSINFFNIDKLKSWLGNNVSDVQYQASMNLISILNSIPWWCDFGKDIIGSLVRHIGKPKLGFVSTSFIYPRYISSISKRKQSSSARWDTLKYQYIILSQN